MTNYFSRKSATVDSTYLLPFPLTMGSLQDHEIRMDLMNTFNNFQTLSTIPFLCSPMPTCESWLYLWFCVGYTEITLEKIETHTKSENSSIIDIYSWSFCVCTDLYTPAMCFISVAIFRFSCNIIGNIEKGISLLDIGRFFYFPKSEYCQDFIQGIYSLFVFTQMKTMKPM